MQIAALNWLKIPKGQLLSNIYEFHLWHRDYAEI
jgi:hypothetical protein